MSPRAVGCNRWLGGAHRSWLTFVGTILAHDVSDVSRNTVWQHQLTFREGYAQSPHDQKSGILQSAARVRIYIH